MTYTTEMQLNKLGYDRERQVVEFSMRRNFDETAIVIAGEVPMTVLDAARLLQLKSRSAKRYWTRPTRF